jgi:hypothetical protein
MGTNYYLELEDNVEDCPHCGQDYNPKLHIGKSSAGWCFSLHVIPESGINSLYDWMELFKKGKIFDEYDEEIPVEQMLRSIRNRVGGKKEDKPHPIQGFDNWDQFHRANHSEFGPNNLLRHKLDGRHCVGHGEGTWDLIAGEFS